VPAYGLWGLVPVNSVIFILFTYSFFKPQTPQDWRYIGLTDFLDQRDREIIAFGRPDLAAS